MPKLLQTTSALALALLLALPAAGPVVAQDEAPTDEATGEAPANEGAVQPDMEEAPAEATAAEGETAPATPAEAPTRDSVVASVNGVAITLGEVIIAASQLPPQYQQLPPDVLFTGVTDQLVQQELLAQTVTTEPPRVALALANERRSLLAGEVIAELSGGALSEEAVQAAYETAFAGQEAATEWNAAHILVATEAEAQAVVGRLDAGEDFAAVAAEVSTDTGSGAAGGELGWFSPGMMVPEFEAGVTGLDVGALSAPVESQFGWHVIRLNDTRPVEPPALDEVRGEIEDQVRQAAIEGRLAELSDGAEITRPEPGQFDPAVLGDLTLLEE